MYLHSSLQKLRSTAAGSDVAQHDEKPTWSFEISNGTGRKVSWIGLGRKGI